MPEKQSGNNLIFRLLCIAQLPKIRNNLFITYHYLSIRGGGDPGPGYTPKPKPKPNLTKSHHTHQKRHQTSISETTNQKQAVHTKRRGNHTQSQIVTNCHYKQKKITPNAHSRNHKSGIGTSLKKGAGEDLRENW